MSLKPPVADHPRPPPAPLAPGRLRNLVGHLIVFLAVVEARSFHGAARSVGKSQPVVTAQIRDLEELLGARLFVRTTRLVQLTPAGRQLQERAVPLVGAAQALVRDFRNAAALVSGNLRISVSPTVAIGWMPGAIRRLAETHSALVVSIREDLAENMFAAVMTGDVAFGIGPFDTPPSALTFTALTRQDFWLVVPGGHPLAVDAPIRIEDIPTEAVLCAGIGTTARARVEAAFNRIGVALRARHEAQHVQAVLGMVREGLGIAIIPSVGERLVTQQGLVCRRIEDADLFRQIGLIEVRGIARSEAAAEFIRLFPPDPA